MAKGLAVCIGVNKVSKIHYQSWKGKLRACEADAKDIAEIAKTRGFKVRKIFTKDATRGNVIKNIKNAAKSLKSGDIFMLTYAGHGGQIRDKSGDEWEDGLDETWCLYDGQLLDDELYTMWESFKKGVRILVISDSCHSGTVIDVLRPNNPAFKTRLMPFDVAPYVYLQNKEFYDRILEEHKNKKRMDVEIKASVLFISGCQDNQLSVDCIFNGLFTSKLKKVWNNGKFRGDYRKFHGQIVKRMPSYQTPNYVSLGEPNREFERQKPFTI